MTHSGGHHWRARRTIPLALCSGVLVGCTIPGATPGVEAEACALPAEDVARIRDLEAGYEQHVQAADLDAMAVALDDDIVLMAPNQADIVGKTQFREWLKVWEDLTFKTYAQVVESVVGCGDLAYVKVSYSVAVAPLGAADVVSDSGRGVHLLRKRSDGAWVITHHFFSSDRPNPAG